MNFNSETPYYIKLGFKLLLLCILFFIISAGQSILVPIAFSIVLGILLLPLNKFLEKRGVPRVVAILISLTLGFIVIGGVIYFLSTQISNFVSDIPSIKKNLNDHLLSIQKWVREKFNITLREQREYLNEKLQDSGESYLSDTFFTITEALMLLFFLPIYSFLILYYRDLIKKFLFAVFKQEHSARITAVLDQSKTMVHNYMLGLLIEMGIIAVLNSVGLMMLGIKYAIFLGVFTAILNIMPFIGIFIGTLFTILITLTTSTNTSDLVWIAVILYVIHFIDSNILMPRIVGSRVRINSLVSIIGVVIGGALTGLSGIFLSVPAVAFIKILCDHTDGLKPWGLLMGDADTSIEKNQLYYRLRNLKRKQLKKAEDEDEDEKKVQDIQVEGNQGP
ncbi:MAG: AI-2E family transporter [Chitinophagaceae bacterium]